MDLLLWELGAIALAIFATAYLLYGRWVARRFGVDDARETPAHSMRDGTDFVPTPRGELFLQHFSAISAAGPIVGPIMAASVFGWMPALCWVLLGCVFIGAVHDFATLTSSVRHGAHTMAEMVRQYLGREAWVLFTAFIWLALGLVVINFTDVTARAFLRGQLDIEGASLVPGPAVATSSLLYLGLALAMGWLQSRAGCSARWLMPLGLAALLLILWLGTLWPLALPETMGGLDTWRVWVILILAYCALASVMPVPLLLQPRGFLGGALLWIFLAVGVLGLFLSDAPVHAPAWIEAPAQPLFPVLFVTIACGACSGFHGLVCSGTTSKQVSREGHLHSIGYGAMLLEGLVAVIAIATFMLAPAHLPGTTAALDPSSIFATGIASFAAELGIPVHLGLQFGFLALATFIYDTLDVCARLGRHILQELWRGLTGRTLNGLTATLITLALPATVLLSGTDYNAAWRVFGASNQLVAGLSLVAIFAWLRAERRARWYIALPMLFVLALTLTALVRDTLNSAHPPLLRGFAATLLLVALLILGLALRRQRSAPKPAQ